MVGVEGGSVDGLLQVHAEEHMVQEKGNRPLVLLVAARRAEGKIRCAVSQHQTRRQCRPRAAPGSQRASQSGRESEHLRSGSQAEAKARNDWRALQPAAAWRRGNHVAEPVGNVEMAGIAWS